MKEIVDHAASLGFYFTPELDGKIHRFDRNGKKEVGWYVGWQLFSSKYGHEYYICLFGDWRTSERYEYRSQTKQLSREDHKLIKVKLAEAAKRAEEDRQKKQDEAKSYAKKIWARSRPIFESPYFERKKISKLYGTQTTMSDETGERVVCVPMRDIDGEIWGMQRIYADGQKFFLSGQRTKGLFHVIGSEITDGTEIIYLVEGFATGASVHEATEKTTVVAFNAGNLVPVATELRRRYHSLSIVVAGDDDTKTDGNPGRTKAEEAAKQASGVAAFPPEPGDWNDYHVAKGIKAVSDALEPVEPDPCGYIALGFDRPHHFFYAKRSNDIVRFSSFASENLMQLMPLEYWESIYLGKKSQVNWEEAKSALITESADVGPFNCNKVRGTGVWYERGRAVVNTGSGDVVSNDYIYVATKNKMKSLHPKPLSAEECDPLREACRLLKWTDPNAGTYLAGWLAVARVAGALPIRPHLWLSGPSGSGKSTVMDQLIRPALGHESGRLYLQGGSTEAGIRQSVKADSLPIIFDEFETTGESSKQRVESIIELFRQSWSRTEGQIVKGSAGGEASQYALSFAGLVSSIRTGLTNDADRSRFTIIELATHGSDAEHYRLLKSHLKKIDEEFGERLFARQIKNIAVIIKNYEIISESIASRVNRRVGQQIGMLMAGYVSLFQDEVIKKEEADMIAVDLGLITVEEVSDHVEALNYLMDHRIRIYGDVGGERRVVLDKSIMRIIEDQDRGELEQLKDCGIIIENESEVYISSNHSYLKGRIFKGTRWEHNFYQTLLRIPGAKRTAGKKRFKSHVSSSVIVPIK